MRTLKPIDHAVLRVNQATIISLLLLAFIVNLPWLVGAVAVIMLAGSLLAHKAGFFWVTRYILRPLGLAKPDVIPDHAEPHLFAQGFGGTVLVIAAASLFSGLPVLGWALTWVVMALAALNLFGGFCLGCAIYYWFNRLHVPGFIQQAPGDGLPGFRPRSKTS